MKIKSKIKECRLIVTVKMGWGEAIDEPELTRFSRASIKGFLKPSLIKNNQYAYSGPVGIALFERLKKPITKHEFFVIVEQVVVAIQRLERAKISIQHKFNYKLLGHLVWHRRPSSF